MGPIFIHEISTASTGNRGAGTPSPRIIGDVSVRISSHRPASRKLPARVAPPHAIRKMRKRGRNRPIPKAWRIIQARRSLRLVPATPVHVRESATTLCTLSFTVYIRSDLPSCEVMRSVTCPGAKLMLSFGFSNEWSDVPQAMMVGGITAAGSLTGTSWCFDGKSWMCLTLAQ